MLKQKILRGPHKHSLHTQLLPPNLIYRRLQLDEVFRDLDVCDKYPDLYEHERMPPRAPTGAFKSWMNERFSKRYTNNLFYSPKTSQKIPISDKFKIQHSDVIKDLAHVSIYYNIWKQISSAEYLAKTSLQIFSNLTKSNNAPLLCILSSFNTKSLISLSEF